MNKLLVDSQKKYMVGRRLLLKTKHIYNKKSDIPAGAEEYLWLYSVTTVNDDCTLATITFEKKYVEKDGITFQSYHDDTGDSPTIERYDLSSHLKKDHERYNTYLAKVNKARNDKEDEEKRKASEEKARARDDLSDLEQEFKDGTTPYALLVGEFVSDGDI